jgi:ABC-type Na+ efflux pump permease subunit
MARTAAKRARSDVRQWEWLVGSMMIVALVMLLAIVGVIAFMWLAGRSEAVGCAPGEPCARPG